MSEDKSAEPPSPPLSQLLIDLGPVAIFVIAFNVLQKSHPDSAVYIATGLFIVATLAAIVYCKLKRGKIPPVLIVTGVLVVIFGGLTLVLHDRTFIQLKPTVLYGFYAAAIGVSVLLRQNIWKLFFGHVFVLPERIWTILALRWAGFFVFMALLNEYIRHTQSMEFWVNSRIFISFPLIFLFAAINAPITLKYSGQTSEAEAKP
ncbi:MAG: inner membrane-spanning protein YciB [Alphaproteobacteria bacterium]